MYLKDSKVEIPEMYICPLSKQMMHDPVIADDGYTYERKAIKDWLTKHAYSSPMTHRWMFSKLVDNHSLKDSIEHFIRKENEKYELRVKHLAEKNQMQDHQVNILSARVARLELEKAEADAKHAKAIATAEAAAKAAEKETAHARALAKAEAKAEVKAKEAEHAKAMGKAHQAAASAKMQNRRPVAPQASARPQAMAPYVDSHALEQTAFDLCQSKQFDRAAPIFQQLYQSGHASIRFFNQYGNALNKLRRPAEAIEMFSKALSINPDDNYALKGRGFAYKNHGRAQEALNDFARVFASNPGDVLAQQQVQNLNAQLGRRALPAPGGFVAPHRGGAQSAFAESAQGFLRGADGQVHQAMFFSQTSQGNFRPSQMFSKHR